MDETKGEGATGVGSPAEDPVARASELMAAGAGCAPAVFAAFAPRLGMGEEEAARAACCFRGGMAGSAGVCGAVTGAMMVIGLAEGSGTRPDAVAKQAAHASTRELWRRFTELHGSIVCRELLGVDISTPEGHARAAAEGLFETRCVDLVRGAAELLAEAVSRKR